MEINWKKLLSDYLLYWFLQIILPVVAFLLPDSLTPGNKAAVLFFTIFFPALVILPVSVALKFYKENKKILYVKGIYKALAEYYLHSEYLRNDYHRITRRVSNFRIAGSDVFGETTLQGFNNHPEGKISTEMKLFIAGDASSEGFEFSIRDNLRRTDLQPIPIFVRDNLILYKIEFPPMAVGEKFDLTINRHWKGCIVKREEYVFIGFKHEIRGTDLCEGEIVFDQQPLTYYATTMAETGEIERTNAIELQDIIKTEAGYELKFKIRNPKNIYIINFVLRKPPLLLPQPFAKT